MSAPFLGFTLVALKLPRSVFWCLACLVGNDYADASDGEMLERQFQVVFAKKPSKERIKEIVRFLRNESNVKVLTEWLEMLSNREPVILLASNH